MIVKVQRWSGFAGGALLVLSSLAHAFLGWPPFRAALRAADVDARLAGALAVGWYFGSVAMLTFGVIVLRAAWKLSEDAESARGPVKPIAIAYLLFGFSAFLMRDFNPHFLVFILTGSLLAGFAYRGKS